MKIKQLLVIITLVMVSTNLYARKPAVEDFVGVETESYQEVPPAQTVGFNFGEKVSKNSIQLDTPTNQMNIFSIVVLMAFSALPFLMWFGLTANTTQEQENVATQEQTQTESKHNVESLSDYRESQEVDEQKKAS